jgi:hypothetical protein
LQACNGLAARIRVAQAINNRALPRLAFRQPQDDVAVTLALTAIGATLTHARSAVGRPWRKPQKIAAIYVADIVG